MKVIDVSQRSPEWHEWRKGGVSASEAAIITGRSHHKTLWRLWAEKIGLMQPEDLSRNPNVIRGVLHEDDARRAFEDQHPGEFALPVCGESETYSFLRASYDGVISQGIPTEFKCPCDSVWEDIQANGEQSESYQEYWPQVQQQIFVSGDDVAYGYLVFWKQGEEIITFKIERDNDFYVELVEKAQAFVSMVESKTPPEMTDEDFYMPANRQDKFLWDSAASVIKTVDKEVKELQQRLETLTASKKEAEAELTNLMGSKSNACYAGVKITRYQRRGKINYNKYFKDHFPDHDTSDLDDYRSAGSNCIRTTVTDLELPELMVDEDHVEEIQEIRQTGQSQWF